MLRRTEKFLFSCFNYAAPTCCHGRKEKNIPLTGLLESQAFVKILWFFEIVCRFKILPFQRDIRGGFRWRWLWPEAWQAQQSTSTADSGGFGKWSRGCPWSTASRGLPCPQKCFIRDNACTGTALLQELAGASGKLVSIFENRIYKGGIWEWAYVLLIHGIISPELRQVVMVRNLSNHPPYQLWQQCLFLLLFEH